MHTDRSAGPVQEQLACSFPLRRELLLFLLISALLLIPCFWHAHIEAGDLGSHVYNAWLAQLIEQGKAPGLYTVPQWNNVLLDALLLNLSKAFGFVAAERIAASLCVLTFFWGVFLLMKAVSGQPPWFLTPVIAMLAYGLIFYMGFLNYYLSVGLCCMALSLLWAGRRNGLIAAVLMSPVMLFAHPLGFVLFVSVGAYRLLWMRFPGWWKWLLPVGAIGLCLALRWFVSHHPGYEVEWRETAIWRTTGADQFNVFGARYVYFTRVILLIAFVSAAIALYRSGNIVRFWRERRFALELYVVAFVVTVLLPENVHTDPTAGWIGQVVRRLTLVIAIFALCGLATLPARRWHLAAYGVVAVIFFAAEYRDTGFLNRIEANTEQITRQLPFGTRAIATIHAPPDYRALFVHIPDRACIGHCFLVSNYEPSTKQFRIRVRPGSPVVTTSVDDSEDMQSGVYEVQDEDLPLKQIYQCDKTGRDLTAICIRDLAEEEMNGRMGYVPYTPDAPNPQDGAEPQAVPAETAGKP